MKTTLVVKLQIMCIFTGLLKKLLIDQYHKTKMSLYDTYILPNLHKLVMDLDVDCMLGYLLEKRIFTTPQVEEILGQKTKSAKALQTCNLLRRRGPQAVPTFLEGLQLLQPELHCSLTNRYLGQRYFQWKWMGVLKDYKTFLVQQGGCQYVTEQECMEAALRERSKCVGPYELTMVITEKQHKVSKFSTCQDRLNTFTNWPKYMRPRPTELAKAGLYYCGVGDKVQCPTCNIVLQEWEPNDDPFEDHLKYSPNCPYMECVYPKPVGVDTVDC